MWYTQKYKQASQWGLCQVPSALLQGLPEQPLWEVFGHQLVREVVARRLLKDPKSLSTGEVS